MEVGAEIFCEGRDGLKHTVVEDANRSSMPFLTSYEWSVCIACIRSFAAFNRKFQSLSACSLLNVITEYSVLVRFM